MARDGTDRFPIVFRPDCERTPCDWRGESEGLFDILQRLDRAGYDLCEIEEMK